MEFLINCFEEIEKEYTVHIHKAEETFLMTLQKFIRRCICVQSSIFMFSFSTAYNTDGEDEEQVEKSLHMQCRKRISVYYYYYYYSLNFVVVHHAYVRKT